MAHFTKLQRSEIKAITKKYNLDLIDFDPIEQGQSNTTYLLQTSRGIYILTVFQIKKNRVINLVKLLNHLHEHKFPTTRVEKMANGEELISIRGKLAILKPYIPGEVVKDIGKEMISQVGTAMAKLHQIPVPDYLPKRLEYGLDFIKQLIELDIDPGYKKWLTQRIEDFSQNIPSGLPRGLIHGDVYYDNILFDGKKFKALIDFEEACNYFKVFGLGMAIVGMCSEKEIHFPKVQSLLNGYQKIRKLERNERRFLKLFIEYAASATSAWRYWKYNIDTPTVEKADHYKEVADLAKSTQKLSDEKFMTSVFP